MSHTLLGDARLYVVLLQIDGDLRDEVRSGGCANCGGALHVADYGRKPRGGAAKLPQGYEKRFSLCCSREGCRARAMPMSVRFLGRRVYLGAVFLLACAMRHGLTPRRVGELRELLGVSRRTLERWRRWWLEVFRTTPVWKAARGLLATPLDPSRLPASLLERFGGDPFEQVVAALRFLSPLSARAPAVVPGKVNEGRNGYAEDAR